MEIVLDCDYDWWMIMNDDGWNCMKEREWIFHHINNWS